MSTIGKIIHLDKDWTVCTPGTGRIVFCHGVFDVLHPGHIAHLKEAKVMGDCLVVGVTSDRYVNKGPGHPVYSQDKRMEQLAALEMVDYVVLSDYPTGCEVISALKPNIVVKGSDYEGRHIPEMDAVAAYGGKFVTTVAPKESVWERIKDASDGRYSAATETWLARFKERHTYKDVLQALDAAKTMKVLLVGEYIQDRYTLVSTLAKSPREHHMSTRVVRQENYPGGVVAIQRHMKPFVASTYTATQIEGIVKERFVEEHELRKLFSSQQLPDTLTMSTQGLKQVELCGNYDLVVVADYGHGLITAPIRKALEKDAKFLAVNCQSNSANYGFNLATKWKRYDYLCLDGPELALARNAGFQLALKVMVTRGKEGASFGGYACPALATRVVDRVGAGDSLFALTAPLVAAKVDPAIVVFIGNCAAAIQCETLGNERSVDRQSLENLICKLLR